MDVFTIKEEEEKKVIINYQHSSYAFAKFIGNMKYFLFVCLLFVCLFVLFVCLLVFCIHHTNNNN